MTGSFRTNIMVLSIVTLLLCGVQSSNASDPIENLTLIIDCSKSMVKPFPTGAVTETGTNEQTRLGVVKKQISQLIDKYSRNPKLKLGIWLLGHRLRWDDQPNPDVQDQTDYLAATNGFGALRRLVPGEDVQLVLPLQNPSSRSGKGMSRLMPYVRPWGESPTYLALDRAINSTSRKATRRTHRIVLITDGSNEQAYAPTKKSAAQVLGSATSREVSIHVIYLGNRTTQSAANKSYLAIAKMAGGTVHLASDSRSLPQLIEKATTRPTPKPSAVTSVSKDGKKKKAKPVSLHGTVKYFSRVAKNFSVTLISKEHPPQKTKTDRSGRFVFKRVVSGAYTIQLNGVLVNKIFDRHHKLKVTDQPIDIVIKIR